MNEVVVYRDALLATAFCAHRALLFVRHVCLKSADVPEKKWPQTTAMAERCL